MTFTLDRTGVGAGRDDWQTPPDLFAMLHRRYRFNYDAFASRESALCDLYSTVDETVGWLYPPGQQIASVADGLTFPWSHLRVFMNPPYSRGNLERCVAKAASERNNAEIIVALLPCSTDTGWRHEHVAPFADVYLLRGRVRFIDPKTGEQGGSPPGGSAIAVYRPDWLSGQPWSGR